MDQTGDNSIQEEKMDVKNNVPLFKLHDPVTNLNTNLMTPGDNPTSFNQDSSSSFVVLGKDSMDVQDAEGQASVLASYIDIHRKSMSVDYKSIVSSMTADEMQKRLTEILQENVKLKETLKQNNVFMIQNFNKLMAWQEEVTKVHNNHKQKFAETTELIKHLKKENTELKAKLAHLQYTDTTEFEVFRPERETLTHTSQAELEKSTKLVETGCGQAETPGSQKCSEACSAKDEKIADLQKSVALLEQKLQCTLSPIQLTDLTELSMSNRKNITQITTQYNDIARDLTESFAAQIERFAVMEQDLKESIDMLATTVDDDKLDEQFLERKQTLCRCCRQLADEQLNIITDRQTLIKSQKQLHNMLCEYKSVLYELELTRNENAKLKVMIDNATREIIQLEMMLEEAKRTEVEEQSLEKEKKTVEQMRYSLMEEKMLLHEQKKRLEIERDSFSTEQQFLEQQKIVLNEEKMSLDHQSHLYENSKELLEEEKKIMASRFKDLTDKSEKLQQKLQQTDKEFAEVLEQVTQRTEEINVLKEQLKLYEEDFEQERNLKEKLLEEKNKLEKELQKQMEFNIQLQQSGSARAPAFTLSMGEDNSTKSIHSCPKCDAKFKKLQALLDHVQHCIDECMP